MLKERIDEIIEDMRGRFRNPLILSFLLVWLYFHWRFLYEIFTVDTGIPVVVRGDYFKTYVIKQGWSGMIGYPILYAIISLSSYYLIGVVAQFIKLWLGKRLPAAIFVIFDKGKYELKVVTERIKKENRELREKEEKLIEENEQLKSKARTKDSEIDTLNELHQKNIEEKDKEIGTQMALNSELHQEKKVAMEKLEMIEKEQKVSESNLAESHIEISALMNEKKVLEEKIKSFEAERITSRDLSSIFTLNSTWVLEWTLENKTTNEKFSVLPDNRFDTGKPKGIITITDFLYNVGEGVVSFKKTNRDKGYINKETFLFKHPTLNIYTGFEGENITVIYKSAAPLMTANLTTREMEILKHIAEGLSAKEIGEKLFISQSTVETYRKNLMEKLGITNSKLLLKYAIEHGYGNK